VERSGGEQSRQAAPTRWNKAAEIWGQGKRWRGQGTTAVRVRKRVLVKVKP
jgi:hypothetical protein